MPLAFFYISKREWIYGSEWFILLDLYKTLFKINIFWFLKRG
ncbi:hypothetical protein bcere0022_18840 [Bacillus cereus Rock3-44]|nr:hypothetical protein bcere0022_18840 [Bacillus cereus Rock3-44]